MAPQSAGSAIAAALAAAVAVLLPAAGAQAQQLLWTYTETSARTFAGVMPDGHSVLFLAGPNSVEIERIDGAGAPEVPFELDLADAQLQADVIPTRVEVDAIGGLHVQATAQPPNAALQYRYYRYSPNGVFQWVLSSAADSNVCERSRLSESGGRVFLCDELVDANPNDADFELRFRVSRYGANGALEFTADPAVGLDNSATRSASASVVLAAGANGRAGFGGLRSVTLDGQPQPRALFGVVVNANGTLDWNQDYSWIGFGNQVEPPWPSRAELGSGGELGLYGEGYGPGLSESQYTVIRFDANGGSAYDARIGEAIGNGTSGLVVGTGFSASGRQLAAGRCVTAAVTLIPCYVAIDPDGTIAASNFGTALNALPAAYPGVVDFAIGLADEALLDVSADSNHSYLRRLRGDGSTSWELGYSYALEAVKSANIDVDEVGDFYHALQFAPFSFSTGDRIELRKYAGGDIFRDGYE